MNQQNVQQHLPKEKNIKFCDNVAMVEVSASRIEEVVSGLYNNNHLPLKLITATDENGENECFNMWYIFGVPKENAFIVPYIRLQKTTEFPSLTPRIHEAWNYERVIQTFFGLTPVGHPDPKPILLHENWPTDIFPLRKNFAWDTRPKESRGTYAFQKVEGEGIYEIPVGPIHAGIIEPGHFRFSVAGESIVLLEPRLGFTHKGSEKLFETLSLDDKIRLSEKISGDSSFSHSLAFCQALERLSGNTAPKRAEYLRLIYAELERLANHFGDIGAIMLDTGFNFGGAHGARLREMVMRIHERLTGSRFLRGVNTVGGITRDINHEEKEILFIDLSKILKDFSEVIGIAENSASLSNRLKGTGVLSAQIAKDRGVVGVAGKAVGIQHDARIDYPYSAYNEISIGNIPIEHGGDVYARFRIRIEEVHASVKAIHDALDKLPEGNIMASDKDIIFKKNAIAVGIVEGWRGDIVYFIATDSNGRIKRVAPRDPSFLNWPALGDAGFDNVVPDFPLINKSFNLSYSGNDL